MIVILAALAGAIWGGRLARRRGGKTPDVVHYAAGYAIAFALLGLFATIFVERLF